MDPLSALSVAASLVQFLDFGAKLVGTTLEVYRSVEGATKENLETEYLVRHARDLSAGLLASQKSRGSLAAKPDEAKLLELAQRSQALAQELLDLLSSLQGRAQHKSWFAVQQAIKLKWNDSKIQSLRTRLDSIKSELSLQLLCMMSNERSSISASIQDVEQRCRKLEVQSQAALAEIQVNEEYISRLLGILIDKFNDLSRAKLPTPTPEEAEFAIVVQMLNRMQGRRRAEHTALHKDVLEQLVKAGLHNTEVASVLSKNIDGYSDMVSALAPVFWPFVARHSSALPGHVNEIFPLALQLPILESLRFTDMMQRETAITEAFAKTYAWIFERERSPLAEWMENRNGVFWVSGKPGSGKSTLMKFITHHKETRRALDRWAAGKSLVMSKHFFLGTGTREQKSYKGLLQSLLFHIFRERPALIEHACPSRWTQSRSNAFIHDEWDVPELKETLQRTLSLEDGSPAFCIFIDGLDEFAEEHFDLITEVIELHAKKPNVKFCVSSRPYNVFSSAFGNDQTLTFALQDMNAGDIDIFVKGRLEQDPRFRQLVSQDTRADGLAFEIRRRAAGVFLWVHLVVWELRRGLDEGDALPMLQARLDALPETLEEFFTLMIKSVDKVYRQYTARSLLLAHRAREPLPVMAYALLYEDSRDASYLASVSIAPLTREEINHRRTDIDKKISSWCKGLMEVRMYDTANIWEPLRRFRVDFLHRSVQDYLETSDMQRFLHEHSGADFEPCWMLALLFVAQAKVVNVQGGLNDEMQAFDFMAGEAKYYARMHDLAKADRSSAFGRYIARELETIEHQIKTQKASARVPDFLKVPQKPPGSRSRSSSASEAGRRSPLGGLFSKLFESKA